MWLKNITAICSGIKSFYKEPIEYKWQIYAGLFIDSPILIVSLYRDKHLPFNNQPKCEHMIRNQDHHYKWYNDLIIW